MQTNLIANTPNASFPSVQLDHPWSDAAQEWLSNFRSERTRVTYRAAWRNFLAWFGRHPASATRQDLITYREWLAAKGLHSATIGLRLAALASFFERVKRKGLIEQNPVEGVDRPKVQPYSAARWLTTGEAARLLRAPDRDSFEGKRDYAILTVMLLMGLRRAEVADMRRGDFVERGDGSVDLRYKPKGGEERTRPVPTSAWIAIREYLDARGIVGPDCFLWVAHDRAAVFRHDEKALSCEAIRLLVARHARAALGHTINPHALRHTCAGAAWDTTHDLRRVQNLLGHASATTTEKYLHRRDDDRGALGDALAVSFGIA